MTLTRSGEEITLKSGEYAAHIVTVGAGLISLTLKGKDLIYGHDPDGTPAGHQSKTLIPWPNRIVGGVYTWHGKRYELPINEHSSSSALHGLAAWVDWRILHADQDSATLETFIAPRPGYPWALQSWVTYALDKKKGLSVTIATRNIDAEPAPYGASFHPYLALDQRVIDQCVLDFPAEQVLEIDEQFAPKRLIPVADIGFDFTSPRIVGATEINHAFRMPASPWTVSLSSGEGKSSVTLSADTPWLQIYTGETLGRKGLAAEPMTCAPNAFNTGEDIITLEPGQETSMNFGIAGHFAD